MDPKIKEYIKKRALAVIKARSQIDLAPDQLPVPGEPQVQVGGAMRRAGKHREGSKTKRANPHAQLVGKLMREEGLTLAQASKEAKKIRSRK
jgi:hypothetical protein